MKVTYKYVGQGDSIILEWQHADVYKIGIIDCNRINKDFNPVLEHIKNLPNKPEVEFIVLSHPHSDHFSGFLELLEYLDSSEIKISNFLHTSGSDPRYLAGLNSVLHKTILAKIFMKVDQMYADGKIVHYVSINDRTREILLTDEIKLEFLYPTTKYINQFNRKQFKNDTYFNNHPDGNLLSTCIKISSPESFFLFTSDCVSEIFDEIVTSKSKHTEKFISSQVPHHGSKENFNHSFWKAFKSRDLSQSCIISYGKNDYGHPDQNSLRKLRDLSYNIHATFRPKTKSILTDLDMFSESVSSTSADIASDLSFIFDGNSLTLS